MERGREEKKLRESEKGRRESQAVHNAKDVNKYSTVGVSLYLVAIFDHLLHTPPSFHHRSTLAPASLHPRITLASPSPNLPNHIHPFHLPFHPQLSTYFTPFLCLSGRARSCGEAARQGVENPNRWENIGTCRKQ